MALDYTGTQLPGLNDIDSDSQNQPVLTADNPLGNQYANQQNHPGRQPAITPNVSGQSLASNQVTGLLQPDSALRQAAVGDALDWGGKRGMVNSNMTAQAGVGALMDRVTPLAQQNADVFAKSQQTEQANQNTLGQMEAAQGYNRETMGLEQEYNLENMSQQQLNTLEQMAAAQGYNLESMTQQQINELAQLAAAHDYLVEDMSIEQRNNLERMATSQGYNLETMSQDQINQLVRMAESQGYNLETMSQQQINELAQMATAQEYNVANMSQAQLNTLSQLATAQGYNLETMSQQQVNELAQMATSQGYNLETMTQQQINQLAQMATAQEYNVANMSQAQRDALQTLATTQGYTVENMTAQQVNELAQMATAQGYNLETLTAEQANTIAQMDVAQRYNVANMQTQHANTLSEMQAQSGYTMDLQDDAQAFDEMITNQGYNHQDRQLMSQLYAQWVDTELTSAGRIMADGGEWNDARRDAFELAINAGKTWIASAFNIPLDGSPANTTGGAVTAPATSTIAPNWFGPEPTYVAVPGTAPANDPLPRIPHNRSLMFL